MKTQIMGGKVCWSCKGKTLLGVVNKLLKKKSFLTSPSNVEGDGIKSRLFSTLHPTLILNNQSCTPNIESRQPKSRTTDAPPWPGLIYYTC